MSDRTCLFILKFKIQASVLYAVISIFGETVNRVIFEGQNILYMTSAFGVLLRLMSKYFQYFAYTAVVVLVVDMRRMSSVFG